MPANYYEMHLNNVSGGTSDQLGLCLVSFIWKRIAQEIGSSEANLIDGLPASEERMIGS